MRKTVKKMKNEKKLLILPLITLSYILFNIIGKYFDLEICKLEGDLSTLNQTNKFII